MAHKFIIAVNSTSKEQEDAFLKHISDNGYGWWHYIDNFWLITTSKEIEASELRDVAKELFNNENVLVIEVFGSTWSGFGPKNDKENMFTWIHKNWK
ncbi:MAG TPA: hypothetical protein VK859_16030 [bacterium]|nr:hypothetical protein [bacterium]